QYANRRILWITVAIKRMQGEVTPHGRYRHAPIEQSDKAMVGSETIGVESLEPRVFLRDGIQMWGIAFAAEHAAVMGGERLDHHQDHIRTPPLPCLAQTRLRQLLSQDVLLERLRIRPIYATHAMQLRDIHRTFAKHVI